MSLVTPMLEFILKLPGTNISASHDVTWAKDKISNDDWTFEELAMHPELMEMWIDKQIQLAVEAGSEDGSPILPKRFKVPGPDEIYKLSSTRLGRRRATVYMTMHILAIHNSC